MPCLGELNLDFEPKLGTNIFEGNEWKVQGSVEAYGKQRDPDLFVYDVDEPRCNSEIDKWPLWDKQVLQGANLPKSEELAKFWLKFEEQESYLRRFS